MAAWSFGAKLLAFVGAMVALTFVDVLMKRATGYSTTFLTGWIMCSLYRAMSEAA